MTSPRRGYEELIKSFLFMIHIIRMIINDYLYFCFRTRALRNAKLIFESPLHPFYRAGSIHTIAALLYRFVLGTSGAV